MTSTPKVDVENLPFATLTLCVSRDAHIDARHVPNARTVDKDFVVVEVSAIFVSFRDATDNVATHSFRFVHIFILASAAQPPRV